MPFVCTLHILTVSSENFRDSPVYQSSINHTVYTWTIHHCAIRNYCELKAKNWLTVDFLLVY